MKDRPLWIRELFAIALALIMLAPICALLTSEGIYNGPRVKTSNEDLMVNVWL